MFERGRPGADAHGGTGLGERLGDGEPEAAVVGDAGDERAASGQIDVEHALSMSSPRIRAKGSRTRCVRSRCPLQAPDQIVVECLAWTRWRRADTRQDAMTTLLYVDDEEPIGRLISRYFSRRGDTRAPGRIPVAEAQASSRRKSRCASSSTSGSASRAVWCWSTGSPSVDMPHLVDRRARVRDGRATRPVPGRTSRAAMDRLPGDSQAVRADASSRRTSTMAGSSRRGITL